jgi:hypothetical protein
MNKVDRMASWNQQTSFLAQEALAVLVDSYPLAAGVTPSTPKTQAVRHPGGEEKRKRIFFWNEATMCL